MYRKLTAGFLLLFLVALMAQPAFAAAAASSPIMDKLGEVEVGLYGQVQPGALLPRIARVETDLFGRPTTGNDAILVRIEKLAAVVTQGGVGGASLLTKLNAAEWMIFQTQTSRTPLLDRIKSIEEKVFGQATTAGIADRVNSLVALVWPGGVLTTTQVPIAPGLKVKAKLLTELKSTSSREGDEVRYQVISDVRYDNKVIIPIGSEGIGVVKQVKKPGPFGQGGQIAIEAGSIRAIDGTVINLTFPQQSNDKLSQSELAAGASLGGMVLLGPLGLAAGYLVQGKSETIPAGTELLLEVRDNAMVQGVSLMPGQ